MAVVTVAQLKAAVAAIPAGANAWDIDVPDGLALPVIVNRVVKPDGSKFYLVKGYVHLDTLAWEPVA